ncbi:MAG: tRNA A37 threonylcarbamoyladenosine dehydratase [Myxococcota bacterium]|jgi:tRNA A37 threonylcarbamoyladenosine dehydratase
MSLTLEHVTVDATLSDEDYRLHRRFDRMGRLVGDTGMQRLYGAHVMVIGVGGVGSFAAEALVRSGVGHVTLVDFDLICITNANRQLHTLRGTVGKPKVDVMAERLRLVNPKATIDAKRIFYNAESSAELLDCKPAYVIDAIDNITAKCHLLAECKRRDQRVLCATGAAARLDPTMIRVGDLSETRIDPLAREVRRILRQKHGFPGQAEGLFGMQAVYSVEEPTGPSELAYDNGEGFRCVCPQGQNGMHECDRRNRIDGTAGFVTGAFGLACASAVVRGLIADPIESGHAGE